MLQKFHISTICLFSLDINEPSWQSTCSRATVVSLSPPRRCGCRSSRKRLPRLAPPPLPCPPAPPAFDVARLLARTQCWCLEGWLLPPALRAAGPLLSLVQLPVSCHTLLGSSHLPALCCCCPGIKIRSCFKFPQMQYNCPNNDIQKNNGKHKQGGFQGEGGKRWGGWGVGRSNRWDQDASSLRGTNILQDKIMVTNMGNASVHNAGSRSQAAPDLNSTRKSPGMGLTH